MVKARAILVFLCLIFKCFMWSIPSVCSFDLDQSSRIIYVPSNYSTIQAAINAALVGDTVFVQNGTYYEHVVVNKSISLIGQSHETTVIDGSNTGITVLVDSDNVTVSNLTTQNGTYGILVQNAHNVVINANNVWNNTEGIRLYNSGNCTVSQNNSTDNRDRGIFVTQCWDSIIYKNTAVNNSVGFGYGINANASRSIAIFQNTAIGNYYDGIGLEKSTNCIVWRNIVIRNTFIGIWCHESRNSMIYHNVVNNNTGLNSVETSSSEISWDSGYPSGGNYWGDYNFTGADVFRGPYQNETGSDGIGDSSYIANLTYHQDSYPLMEPRNNGSAIYSVLQNRSLIPGDNAVIYGFLYPKLAGVNITIYYRHEGEIDWQQLTIVSTSTNGRFSYLWPKPDEGTFELQATWEGNSTTFSAKSLIETLKVQKIASIVSIDVVPRDFSIPLGTTITITGSISPTRSNVNVAIWRRLGGEDWTMVGSVKTSYNGSYLFKWTVTMAGSVEIMSSWQGDTITSSSSSAIFPMFVPKLSSTLTIKVDRTTIIARSTTTINGTLDPKRVDTNVTIQLKSTNGNWTTLSTVKTDSNSNFTYTWQATETGEYQLKASWFGDSVTAMAQSNVVTVTVESGFMNIVFLAAFIIAVIIGIALLIYLRKERRR